MADAVGLAASIVSLLDLAGKVIGYLNDVKDGSKDRARLRDEISSTSFLLFMLKDCTSTSSPTTDWLQTTKALTGPKGPLEQFKHCLDTIAEAVSGNGVNGHRSQPRAAIASLIWPFKKGKIDELIASIERQKSLFSLALQGDHIALSSAIAGGVTAVKEDVQHVKEAVGIIQRDQRHLLDSTEREEKRCVMEWLSPLNFWVTQDDTLRRRHNDTGKWIIESEIFQQWFNATGGTIWCPGIPGAGKTVLASVVIDHLRKHPADTNFGVACAYFNYRDQEAQTPVNIVGALVRQLGESRAQLSPEIKRTYQHHHSRQTKPGREELIGLLKSEISYFSKVFLVFDALDESSDANGARSLVLSGLDNLGDVANIFVTSRQIPSIKKPFSAALRLNIRAEDNDVRKYIGGQLESHETSIRLTPALRQEIEDTVIEKVQGMFLLAELHLKALQAYDNLRDLKRALKNLPTDYDATFSAALGRVFQQHNNAVRRAKQVLSWITHAYRPLTVKELQHAIAVEPDDCEFYEDSIVDSDYLVSICCGLVAVDEGSTTIRLVHYTLEEYLEMHKQRYFPATVDAITTVCITYLSFDEFKLGPVLYDHEMRDRLKKYSLLEYAAENWGRHALGCTSSATNELLRRFLSSDNQKGISAAVQAMLSWKRFGGGGDWSQDFPSDTSGLWLAAHFGLDDVAAWLLKNGSEVDGADSWGWTPLFDATENERLSTVQLLLDAGASLSHLENNEDSVMHVAARIGSIELMRLFRERGVDIDHRNHAGETILHQAAWGGSIEACELLLAWNADPSAIDGNGCTPLHQAAEEGSEAITRLLIDQGLATTEKDKWGKTILLKAVLNGHVDVVRMLLQNGADNVVNEACPKYRARDGYDSKIHKRENSNIGGCALHAASWHGYAEIIGLLVRSGADIHAQTTDGATALFEAAINGHSSATRVLLESGADPTIPCTNGDTPLFAACTSRDHVSVGLLLDHDTRISVTERDVIAIAKYSYIGNPASTLKTLADKRGDDVQINEAVLFAMGSQNLDVWNVLLDHGHVVEITAKVMSSISASWHSDTVTKLLIDRVREIPLTEDVVGKALESSYDSRKFFKVLLDHGKLITVTDGCVAMAAGSYSDASKISLEWLLQQPHGVYFTDAAIGGVAVSFGLQKVEPLLAGGRRICLTKQTVEAELRPWFKRDEMEMEKRGKLMTILSSESASVDDDAFCSLGKKYGPTYLATVLQRQSCYSVTPRGLEAIAKYGDVSCLGAALQQLSTEAIVDVDNLLLACCSRHSNTGDARAMSELLLSKYPCHFITNKVFSAALSQVELLDFLLSKRPGYIVNEERLVEVISGSTSAFDSLVRPGRKLQVEITRRLIQTCAGVWGGESKLASIIDHGGSVSGSVVMSKSAILELGQLQQTKPPENDPNRTYSRYYGRPRMDCAHLVEKSLIQLKPWAFEFDTEMVLTTATCFPGRVTKCMLGRQDLAIRVTDELFDAVAASGHAKSMQTLLTRPWATPGSPRKCIAAIASGFDIETLKLFLEANQMELLDEETLCSACSNPTTSAKELILFILAHVFPEESPIPSAVLEAAVRNPSLEIQVVSVLLSRLPVPITARAIEGAASHLFAPELLRLLSQHDFSLSSRVTEEAFCAAARHEKVAIEVLDTLFSIRPERHVTESMLLAACETKEEGTEPKSDFKLDVLDYLIARTLDGNFAITEQLVAAMAKRSRPFYRRDGPIKLLLLKAQRVSFEAGMRILRDFGVEAVTALVAAGQFEIPWTDGLMDALENNSRHRSRIMCYLLQRETQPFYPDISANGLKILNNFAPYVVQAFILRFWQGPLTSEALEAIMDNYRSNHWLLNFLLEFDPGFEVTESVLEAAIKRRQSKEVIGILLDRGGDEIITKEVMALAKGYKDETSSWYSPLWSRRREQRDKDSAEGNGEDDQVCSRESLLKLVKYSRHREIFPDWME